MSTPIVFHKRIFSSDTFIYLDECQKDIDIYDKIFFSFYGDIFDPFLSNGLLFISHIDGQYIIDISPDTPIISFYIDHTYIRVPYKKEMTLEQYFKYFKLVYSILIVKPTFYKSTIDEYHNFIYSLFAAINNSCPIIEKNDEFYNGTILELLSENEGFPRQTFRFNVINCMG